MFESIQHDGGSGTVACFTSLTASLFVHAAVVGALIVVPMLFIRAMPKVTPLALFYTPDQIKLPLPDIPVPEISTSVPPAGKQGGSSSGVAVEIAGDTLVPPGNIPKSIPPPTDEPFSKTGIIAGPIPGGIAGGGGSEGKSYFNLIGKSPVLNVPKPPDKKPIRIGVLKPSMLIFGPTPVYPEIAKKVRVQGAVHLEAIIDEEGNVTNVKVVSGHILLQDAAVEALKKWKYTPTVRNGEPVPIQASITIFFKLE